MLRIKSKYNYVKKAEMSTIKSRYNYVKKVKMLRIKLKYSFALMSLSDSEVQ